ARSQEQEVFSIKKALGEVSLQDELARLDRLIAASRENSAERIKLEEERAQKTREIRDREESGAAGATGIAVSEYEKQLKAAGVADAGRVARETPLTDAHIAALTQQAELRARGTLERAGLGAGIPAQAP